MQKYDVSKFIISNFSLDLPESEKRFVNRVLIDGIVDGWNNNIYFQPKEIVRVNHYTPKKHEIMQHKFGANRHKSAFMLSRWHFFQI